MAMAAAQKKRLGELLLEAGVIDPTQLQAALGHQRQWGVRLGQALVDLKLATEPEIVEALALKFGYGVARLDALEPYAFEQALKIVPREFAVRNNAFPMAADTGSITIAMSDPTNLAIVDELRFRTGRRVNVCIGGDREVAAAVKLHYPASGGVEAIALDLDVDDLGEAVLDPFGGGSNDAYEAFFGSGDFAGAEPADAVEPAPAPAPVPRAAAPAPAARPAPPGAPAPQPRPAAPALQPGPRPTAPAAAAPVPRPAGPPSPRPAAGPGAPVPARAPASPAAPGTGHTAAPMAPSRSVPARAPAPQPLRAPPPASTVRPSLELEDATARELDRIPGEAVLATDLAPDDEPVAPRDAQRSLSDREREILGSLERLASGAPAEPEIVKPAQAMAAMIRLLIRRGVVSDLEFLDELLRR
jgi:hypothetical protein